MPGHHLLHTYMVRCMPPWHLRFAPYCLFLTALCALAGLLYTPISLRSKAPLSPMHRLCTQLDEYAAVTCINQSIKSHVKSVGDHSNETGWGVDVCERCMQQSKKKSVMRALAGCALQEEIAPVCKCSSLHTNHSGTAAHSSMDGAQRVQSKTSWVWVTESWRSSRAGKGRERETGRGAL